MQLMSRGRSIVVALALGVARLAFAQWEVFSLHPEGVAGSNAFATHASQRVGQVVPFSGANQACLWNGTSTSYVNLHPAGAWNSQATAVVGDQQAGYATINGTTHASLWTGSAESWISLNPAGAAHSVVTGMANGQQVGHADLASGVERASLWYGTAASWVNLHPAGATRSFAFGTDGENQVGSAYFAGTSSHAGLWSGSAASWIDLHPAGATSSTAQAVAGNQQAGVAVVGGVYRACIWHGTAESWTSLHPPGASLSEVRATSGTFQAGRVLLAGRSRASLWSGTADSYVDLHALLPAGYSDSEANGVWSDDLYLCVVGYGNNNAAGGRGEALLWRLPLCFAPEIATQPTSLIACRDGSATFTITASGTTPQYQWRKNEANIEGATAASYTIASVTLADAGSYDCIITNACGTATSNASTLTVRTPQILTQPSSQTVNVDQPVFFALEADPQSPCFSALSYRWQRRNPLVEDDAAPNAWLDLSDGGGFAGTHSPSLAIFRPTPGLATGYRCKITNACGCEADANGVIYTNTVNFAAACPSDFNNDGSVDGDDVIGFFERWDSGC